MSAREKSSYYYLRDWWQVAGEKTGRWVRRGSALTLADAKREAAALAKGSGKGARVQIVRVTSEVVREVAS